PFSVQSLPLGFEGTQAVVSVNERVLALAAAGFVTGFGELADDRVHAFRDGAIAVDDDRRARQRRTGDPVVEGFVEVDGFEGGFVSHGFSSRVGHGWSRVEALARRDP